MVGWVTLIVLTSVVGGWLLGSAWPIPRSRRRRAISGALHTDDLPPEESGVPAWHPEAENGHTT